MPRRCIAAVSTRRDHHDGQLDVVGNQRDRVMAAVASRALETAYDQPVNQRFAIASGRVEIAIPAVGRRKARPLATIW